ncbi:putative MATE efflux family protein subfamily [Zopfochytrium polystomum]|nr:putative MATE efflux family protein subfamily [Zopfochytrium polystomum]
MPHGDALPTTAATANESSPLLLTTTSGAAASVDPAEAWVIVKTSVPVALAYMLQNSLQTGSVLIVGRMGPDELAAAAFAFMFAMVTAWVMALGSATALDTLCSQAWTGASDKTKVGVHLQRAIWIMSLMFLPIAVLWWNVEPVLLLLGQDPELSAMTAQFLRWLILGAPGYIYFEATKKFLQAQGIMHAGTYVLMIASPVNVLLNYVLVWHESYGLGFIGAPIATSITYWLMQVLLVLYIALFEGKAGWGGWTRKSLQNWGIFLDLAIPGIFMVGTEWWAFEIVALAAGLLGRLPMAAQSVIMTTDQIINTLPFGISIATSNRIGNLLGLSRSRHARLSALVSAGVAAAVGGVLMFAMVWYRESFGYLFSDDGEVASVVSRVMPWVAMFQVADGLAASCGGSLRGMGRQHVGAQVNLVAYYVVALPAGFVLAFRLGAGLEGLWIGQCIALFLVGALELVVVWRTDWKVEVEKCQERISAGEVGIPSH